jgi:hypothetical protein
VTWAFSSRQSSIAVADLRGRRLAVDANGELYQFLALIRLPDGVTRRKPPPPAWSDS